MKRFALALLIVMGVSAVTGCGTHSGKVKKLRLGMTPEEARDEMGDPYAIRTAKLFRDGTFTEVWEYIPSIMSVAMFADRYDKSYWLFFDNGRLVQWGEPGDMTGQPTAPDPAAVTEYIPDRRAR